MQKKSKKGKKKKELYWINSGLHFDAINLWPRSFYQVNPLDSNVSRRRRRRWKGKNKKNKKKKKKKKK